jgi:hypothetical protein
MAQRLRWAVAASGLRRRARPGPTSRPAAAPGAVHPADAGDPPVQALHRLPALSVTAGFYRTCVIDGVLEHSPAEHVPRPAVPAESPTLGRHPNYILAAHMASGT